MNVKGDKNMCPFKPGGGNHPQLYDPNNGQYSQEQISKLFEEEMANIVMRYIFGLPQDTYYPRYPILGFHNDDYCKLYVRHAIYDIKKDIPEAKVRDYLLKYRKEDDKSKFFKMHGYSTDNYVKLLEEIYYGSDFTRRRFERFDEFGLTIAVPTKIYSEKEHKKIMIITYWKYGYDKDYMHFITVNINKKEIEKWK